MMGDNCCHGGIQSIKFVPILLVIGYATAIFLTVVHVFEPYLSSFTLLVSSLRVGLLVQRQAEVVMTAFRDSFDDFTVEAAEKIGGIKQCFRLG